FRLKYRRPNPTARIGAVRSCFRAPQGAARSPGMYYAYEFVYPDIGFARSVLHRGGIQAAPQEPGGNGPPRCPGLRHFTCFEARDWLSTEIVQRNCLEQARIIKRKYIRTL